MAHSHHGPTTRLSRLAMFRLKQAEIRRDGAIEAARRRYAAEVDAILAGQRPCLIPAEAPAIANAHPWPWLTNLRALAAGVRRG